MNENLIQSDSNETNIDKNSSGQLGQSGEYSQLPQLSWDTGTAYDFFISLSVLHEPDSFGLRSSWAAGVRSRLSTDDRKTLLVAERLVGTPLNWIYNLPAPKSASSALRALRQLPSDQRLPMLVFSMGYFQEVNVVLKDVADRRSWNEADIESLKKAYRIAYRKKGEHHKIPASKVLASILDAWIQPVEYGEIYLAALENYYQAFFAEEEQQIEPALEDGLRKAKNLTFPELFEQLSQGLHMDNLSEMTEMVLVPSYWCTPLVFLGEISEKKLLVTFGVRPMDASLEHGEVIPDALLRGLKAVSDPTRLRILHYLAQEPMTPAELARRLRLRAPTVTHHLKALRLAGLVHLSLETHGERHYAARIEAINELDSLLHNFVESESGKMILE
jgi:DNA-binding transcriptional ArsR family regulator